MKEITGGVIAFLILVFGLTWLVQGNDFFLYKVFAPKYEATRREVFEQSKAYRQGMTQELENMMFQYQQADDSHKAALADIILHRAADFDEDNLPPHLRQFVSSLRSAR